MSELSQYDKQRVRDMDTYFNRYQEYCYPSIVAMNAKRQSKPNKKEKYGEYEND